MGVFRLGTSFQALEASVGRETGAPRPLYETVRLAKASEPKYALKML
jgi:hypothetical protein